MPQRECDRCGKPYMAQRATSRFCSTNCRVQASKATKPRLVKLPPSDQDESAGSVEDATRSELVAADRLGSALGQAVLMVARRIDQGRFEPGMGMAALVREHRAALAEALRDADRGSDGAADRVRAAAFELVEGFGA